MIVSAIAAASRRTATMSARATWKPFVTRYREVDGFDLGNIPIATPLLPPDLPSYVPLIFHRNRARRLARRARCGAAVPQIL
jgi:hypothetical protein